MRCSQGLLLLHKLETVPIYSFQSGFIYRDVLD